MAAQRVRSGPTGICLFLIAFLLQLLIIKLAVAQFFIPVTVLSKAVVGALLAAKAVLILDETRLGRSLERYRPIVAVIFKTLLYGLGTLLLSYLERFLRPCIALAASTGPFRT